MRPAHWALVALLVGCAWMVYRVETTAQEVLRIKEQIMETLVARWNEADGTEHVVTTPPRQGETDEVHVARHAAKVKLMKAQFPPAP